ncbi:MAG: paraquat-inducible protein A [Lentisphaerota bacterium]
MSLAGLCASLIILIVAIIYPYLEITSFLLIGYSYSIFDLVIALANISLVLSAFMLLTMIVFPILHNVSLLLYFILKLFRKKEYPLLARFIKIFSRFNMLDVFMLGLIIFLVEGGAMVEIEHRLGIVLIALFIFIILVIPQIIIIIHKILYCCQKIDKDANK